MTFTDTATYQRVSTLNATRMVQFNAETKRIEAERQRNYELTGERQIVARWKPFSKVKTAEVTIYRGAQYHTYNVRKGSQSAFRLAFLVGDNGAPLFGDGVSIHKGLALAEAHS